MCLDMNQFPVITWHCSLKTVFTFVHFVLELNLFWNILKCSNFTATGLQPSAWISLKPSAFSLKSNNIFQRLVCSYAGIFGQCTVSLYRNFCPLGRIRQKESLISKPLLKLGWCQFLQYKCTQDSLHVHQYIWTKQHNNWTKQSVFVVPLTDRETGRQTQADRQIDRQTYRQTWPFPGWRQNHQWDQSWTEEKLNHGTGPSLKKEIPMGSIPITDWDFTLWRAENVVLNPQKPTSQ